MPTGSSEGVAVLSYLAVMLRWKWLIIGITLVCLAAGMGYLVTQTPMYSATAKLLYVQPVTISNPLVQGSSQTAQQPDLATVSAIVTSGEVTRGAFDLLEGKDTSAGYWVKVTQPVDGSGNLSQNVVGIEAASASPQTAADAANAVAESFVEWRRESRGTQVEEALAAVRAALETYTTPSERKTFEYLQLRQSQQALELQLESLASDFTVTSPATVPAEPFSPRKRHTLALAGSLGLILGLVLAFLLEQFDTKVRDERQLTEALGMSALGHLPPLARGAPNGGGVQMLSDPSGPMAEAIRVLRGNLSFTGVDGDVRSIIVTSSIRTEGKSVTSSNMAVALALAGQRVVLVDADFRRPRIHSYMHVSNRTGLSSVLARRVDLADALIPVPLYAHSGDGEAHLRAAAEESVPVRVASEGSDRVVESALQHRPGEKAGAFPSESSALLRVLPSGPLPPNPGEMAASQRLGGIIDALVGAADFVIVDTPPLLEVGDAAAMAAKVDGLVFVANMDKVRWPMLERSRAQLERIPCRKLGMVIVAAKHTHKAAYRYEYRPDKGAKDVPPTMDHD